MNARRDAIIARLIQHRDRQFNLPGSEYDGRNTPNDWVAIATHYLGEEVRRGGQPPEQESYEDGLLKAAAVILAALEHVDVMAANGLFQ